MPVPLHHFYHVYADGDWSEALSDHLAALNYGGLLEQLETFGVGVVGSEENIANVKRWLDERGVKHIIVAESPTGWEQETLIPLHEFTRSNTGYVSYAHTKGAAHYASVNNAWRRSMEWYNFCDWTKAVKVLDVGVKIVGCHWIAGGPAENPLWGTGGMFGGNFWWSSCEVLRQAPDIETNSRHAAEHWIGRLSEVMDISPNPYIHDLNPKPIVEDFLRFKW